jgi:hypothetical protein
MSVLQMSTSKVVASSKPHHTKECYHSDIEGEKKFVLTKCNVRSIQTIFRIMSTPHTKNLKHSNAGKLHKTEGGLNFLFWKGKKEGCIEN